MMQANRKGILITGEILKRLRKKQSLSIKNLADKCHFSISYISDIERGRKNPPFHTQVAFLNNLDSSLNEYEIFYEKISQFLNDCLNNISLGKNENLNFLLNKKDFVNDIELYSIFDREIRLIKCIQAVLNSLDDENTYLEIKNHYLSTINNDIFRQLSSLYFAVLERKNGNYSDSIDIIKDAIAMNFDKNITGLCYYHLGLNYENLNELNNALNANYQAIQFFSETVNLSRLVFTQCHLGIIYGKLNDYDQSNSIFLSILNNIGQYGIQTVKLIAANNLIWNYIKTERYKDALILYKKNKLNLEKKFDTYFIYIWIIYHLESEDFVLNAIDDTLKTKELINNSDKERIMIIKYSITKQIDDMQTLINRHYTNILKTNNKDSIIFSLQLIIHFLKVNQRYKPALIHSELLLTYFKTVVTK